MVAEIAMMEERLREAMLTSDVDTLDELIADDLVFVAFTGEIATKEDDLEMHRSGSLSINSLELRDCNLQDLGDSVVVVAEVGIDGTFQSQPASGDFRFVRVWNQRAEGWQIVAGSCTRIDAPAEH